MTRPTVYVCAECGYSHRIYSCRPELARHNGRTIMRCRRCETVREHRVFDMGADAPDELLDACAERCGDD